MQKKGKSRAASALFFAKEISGLSSGFGKNHILTKIGRLVDRINKSLTYTSARAVGCAAAAFGLLSLLMHLSKYYFEENPSVELSTLIIGVSIAILGVPLVFIDKPLCVAMQDFAITDYIFFELFSIKRTRRGERVHTMPSMVGILFGAALAVVAFFLPIEYVLLVVGSVVFVAVSLGSPEFPFLFTVLVLPYASLVPYSDVILASIIALTIISFARKVMLGKRVFVFGISDAVMLTYVAVMIGIGIFVGSLGGGRWLYVVYALGYIPAANMIVNRRLADCAVNVVLVSAAPISVYAIVTYLVNLFTVGPFPSAAFMSSPASLAVYLLASAALALVYLRQRSGVSKALVTGVLCLSLLGIITTQVAPVLIILLCGAFAYAIITRRGAPRELLVLPFALPLGIFFLPSDVLFWVSDVFGMSPTLPELRSQLVSALSALGENLLLGLGAGDSRALLYNTPLGIACRFGVIAAFVVTVMILLRIRQLSVYEGYLESSSLLYLSNMTTLALFAIMALGYFYDVNGDMKIFLLFFTLFGMNTASLRISRREYEDRLGYFGDNRSFDSSDADVALGRR